MPEIIADNISIVETKELEGATRLEAEYYNKPSFIVNNFLKGGKIIDYVQYGTSEDLNEKLKGYPVLRLNEFDGSFIGSPSKYCNKITSEVFNKLVLKEGDILVCRTNGNPKLVGKSAVVMEDANMAFASYLFRVRPKASLINSTTLSVYLNSCIGRREIERNLMVSNQANFSPDKFRDIKVPLFSSEFQAIIDNIVHRAYLNHKCSKLLYSQAEALLLEELNIKNVDLSHEPCYEVNSVDTIAANRIDAEYYQPKYERVIEAIRKNNHKLLTHFIKEYSTGYPFSSKSYLEKGIPLIRINNIQKGQLGLQDVVYIKESDINLSPRDVVITNDIVISMSGTIGASAVIDEFIGKAIINQRILKIRLKDIDADYLCLVLNSIIGSMQFNRIGTGGVQTNISYKDMKNILIPLCNKKLEIANLIRQSHSACSQAKELLEKAKRKVEEMIEKGGNNYGLI